MIRISRFLGKKKGSRQTGLRWWAVFGEVLFSTALIVTGVVLLISLVTVQVQNSTADDWYISFWYFVLWIVVVATLTVVGGYRVVSTLWKVGASAERRGAIVSRSRELGRFNDDSLTDELPYLPFDVGKNTEPGVHLPYRLLSTHQPQWDMLGFGLLALVFVTVSTILLILAWNSFLNRERPFVSLAVALALLAAAGWMLYLFGRQLMVLMAIGPTRIEISHHPVYSNLDCTVHVTQPGRVRLRLLDITLVCVEEATFREGTDVRRESRQVYMQRMLRRRGLSVAPGQPASQRMSFRMPDGAMHSFQSLNNRIRWAIVVVCVAKGWPKFERSFPLLSIPSSSGQPADE